MTVDEIPESVALRLCDEIYTDSRRHWYTASGMTCRGCRHFSGGDARKRCFYAKPGNRGCALVNERYERASGAPRTR